MYSIGDVVQIVGTSFDRYQGVIIDMNSDMEPEDGPIAVFFDREVPYHLFTNRVGIETWRGKPTPENYKECSRVVCFDLIDLLPTNGFSAETMANRLFPSCYHTVKWWKWEFVPNSYLCQMKGCADDAMATMKTYINFFGQVFELHTCEKCHKKMNGMCTESFELKDPLPGMPANAQATT